MKKMLKKLVTLASLACMAFSPLAVQAQDGLVIGGNYEFSGSAASYGSVMAKASALAVKHRNEAGGVLGADVEYIEYDNKSDLTETASVATRLISEGVHALVGPATTGDVMAQVPVANEAGIPVVAPAATGDGITLDDSGNLIEYFFRVCFEDAYQGVAAAQYVYENLGLTKVALVVDQGVDNSVGLSGAFEQKFQELGGEIVTTEYYSAGDTDFTAIVTSLLAQDYEAIYLPAYYTEGGLFVKQARELGITVPILGGDGLSSPTFNELAGAQNVTDVYYTSHFSPASEEPIVKDFVEAYTAEYGQEPDTFAALAYDATNLVMDAAERAGSTDPEAIKEAIKETTDFEGVTGTFSIDENHNPVKPVLMLKFMNGEVDSVEAIEVQ